MPKHEFKSESKRLLDLMVNSIYTHREIFLRELISNASDAIDKLRYISLTDTNVRVGPDEYAINITADKEARTLTISDNGVGMTAEEMAENLGVIAKSGTYAFREKLSEAKGSNDTAAAARESNADDSTGEETDSDSDAVPSDMASVIGQFGVGFYSSFMVSKKVEVISRAYGSDSANRWVSEGTDGYDIEPADRNEAGSDVILHLRDDTDDIEYSDYLEEYTIRNLVKKYSDYIRWPIITDVTHSNRVEKEDGKSEWVDETVRETINSRVPIWQRPRGEVSDEDAAEFYKEQWSQMSDPVSVIRVSVEGTVSYKAMLFIPGEAPYDYFTRDYEPGLKLYASGVMIMERCADLLPEHFRFVRGVVDSPDLSLNISREILQHDRQLKVIAQNLERRIRSELAKLLENSREKYEKFWAAFGIQIKYGLVAGYGVNRDNLRDLVLFYSAKEKKLITLKQYHEAMLSDQQYIYYAVGQSVNALSRLPQTELLMNRGYDVLLLTDEIDDFVSQSLAEYEGKKLKSVRADDLGLESEEEKKESEEKAKSSGDILTFIKDALGDRVKEVKLSPNLGLAPAALGSAGPVTLEMERYFSLMKTGQPMKAERVLELNADHKVFAEIRRTIEADPDRAKTIASTLCSLAELQAGIEIQDARELSDNVWALAL